MTSALVQTPYSKNNVLIRLEDPEQKGKWDKILTRIGATRNNSNQATGWLLAVDKLPLYEEAVAQHGSRSPRRNFKRSRGGQARNGLDDDSKGSRQNVRARSDDSDGESQRGGHRHSNRRADAESRRDNGSDESESESNGSESESDDDELIQRVLARRLRSESSQKVDGAENIEDSDLEDVLSHSRRLRHIYAVLTRTCRLLEELSQRVSRLEGRFDH